MDDLNVGKFLDGFPRLCPLVPLRDEWVRGVEELVQLLLLLPLLGFGFHHHRVHELKLLHLQVGEQVVQGHLQLIVLFCFNYKDSPKVAHESVKEK